MSDVDAVARLLKAFCYYITGNINNLRLDRIQGVVTLEKKLVAVA